jgi:hypothetical protein
MIARIGLRDPMIKHDNNILIFGNFIVERSASPDPRCLRGPSGGGGWGKCLHYNIITQYY